MDCANYTMTTWKTRGHQYTSIKRRKTTKKQVMKRTINWLDLPEDIMITIFMKLGPIEIILIAEKVCSSWRKLAYEPQLFRTINIQHQEINYLKSIRYSKFAILFKEVIHRGCGQLVEVSCVEDLLSPQLLEYVVSKPNSLKTLRIVHHLFHSGFISIFKRLPLLEELVLLIGDYSKELFEVIGHSCQKLRHLRLDYRPIFCPPVESDVQAFAIAKSMTHLHSLHLIGSEMSDKGLQAILAGCPNLEYLDLRCCCELTLEGDVQAELISRIRKVRLPNEKLPNLEF